MIIDDSHRLHECVTDCRSHEVKPTAFEVFAQRVGKLRTGGNLTLQAKPISFGLPTNETPEISVEAARLTLHFEKRRGVLDGCLNLQPVPDDSGIGQQLRNFAPVVGGNDFRIESVK